jgi:hypothetical protein
MRVPRSLPLFGKGRVSDYDIMQMNLKPPARRKHPPLAKKPQGAGLPARTWGIRLH